MQAILSSAEPLLSAPLIAELDRVLRRPKFNRYLSQEERLGYLWSLVEAATPVAVSKKVVECRGATDNLLLELAFDGLADLIVTGDHDLLCLHPWRGIAILSPADYLARLSP